MNSKNNHSGISDKTNAKRISRAMSAIIPLCFFSLLISLFLAFAANDMYAFAKSEGEVAIELTGECSLSECASLLEVRGVVKNPALFSAYVRSKGAEDIITSATGKISLNSDMSYREILRAFAKSQKE